MEHKIYADDEMRRAYGTNYNMQCSQCTYNDSKYCGLTNKKHKLSGYGFACKRAKKTE